MLELIKTKLNQQLMNKTIVVAVSTGIDSMVLLNILMSLNNGCQLIVAHVNHKRRASSEQEAVFIENFCFQNNLPFRLYELPKHHGDNFQAWAREERYTFFERVVNEFKADYLLTAHHNDDLLETMLMRLIRGTSLQGFKGFDCQQIINEQYILYRPLLSVEKQQIEQYALKNEVKYYFDESNSDDYYTRNRFRNHIIPLLKKENEALGKTMYRYSQELKELLVWLDDLTDCFIKEYVNLDHEKIVLPLEPFSKKPDYFQNMIIFSLLKKYQLSKGCVDDIIKQIKSNAKRIINQINHEITMVKEYERLIFIENEKIPPPVYIEIDKDGEYDLGMDRKFIVNKNICYFRTLNNEICYNAIVMPLIVRSKRDEDKIKINNKTKLLNDHLTNIKMSYLERLKVLVVCDLNNYPLFILGNRYNERRYTKNEC